jgi:hypothetical protein
VEHERGIELLEHIGQRESKTVQLEARGETSYNLVVRFVDGVVASDQRNAHPAGEQALAATA